MDTATTDAPPLVQMEQEALGLRGEMPMTIIDQDSYNAAVEIRVEAKQWLKNVRENVFGPMKSTAHAAWKKVCDTEKSVCDPVEAALSQTNRALLAWDQEQERLRREEQRRLEEIARQKAEEERIAEAAALEAAGVDQESVNAVLDAPIHVEAVAIAPPTYEKSSAVQYRDNWGGECFDLLKLAQYVAKNKQHINLLQVNQTALTQLARALKDSLAVPGCRAVNNKVVASGRG